MTKKKKKQKEKQLHEMTDKELTERFHFYTVKKLGWEISQMREAYRLSVKNKKQSDLWIV